MASTKVKRKLLWDAWQLTAESYNEVLSIVTEKATLVSSDGTSITFKNLNQSTETEFTVTTGDWITIPDVQNFKTISVIPEANFSNMFEVVTP